MSFVNSQYKIPPLVSFNKSLRVGSSKSHSNRALILGALLGNQFTVKNISPSTDVSHLINVFKKIGLKVIEKNNEVLFLNSFPLCESETEASEIDLETGDGGTTNRFLIPLLARGKKTYKLFPTERMKERPIDALVIPLKKIGVEIEHGKGDCWIKVRGPVLVKDKIQLDIDCSESSQFASALKLAFFDIPLISINPKNVHSSQTYLDLTNEMINRVLTEKKNSYFVPVDFSSISYPAALAVVLKGKVIIENALERDFLQADSIFLDLLQEIGAQVNFQKDGLVISNRSHLKKFQFDCSLAPDLFPTLVFLAAHIAGESKIFNVEVLKFKESNRILEMIKILKLFKCDYLYNEDENSFSIIGKISSENINSLQIETARDHRIVMSAAMFLATNSGGELQHFDCVQKSFLHFEELFK